MHFNNAQWIVAPDALNYHKDSYFEYTSVFEIENIENVKIYISAYSDYALYINGRFVDAGIFDGYEDYQVYDTLNLSEFVRKGINTLYIGEYSLGANTSTVRDQKPGIIFSIFENEKEVAFSNTKVKGRRNVHYLKNEELISGQLGFNFEYDANAKEMPLTDTILANKEKHLFPRPIKKLINDNKVTGKLIAQGVYKEYDENLSKAERIFRAFLSHKSKEELLKEKENKRYYDVRNENCDGVYLLYSTEGEACGFLNIEIEVDSETEILIGYGEHLEDLRVRSKMGGRNFAFKYIAKPGKNKFMHPYSRLGLKYLQVHIKAKNAVIGDIGIIKTDYPLNEYKLEIKDKLRSKIWDVSVNTLKNCMHEHYEDCPWREQALYAMDSRVQILCGYYAFKEYVFPRASLSLMVKSLRSDGLLELCPPGIVNVNIPSFSAVYIREIWEYYQYTGDKDFLYEVFDGLKTVVRSFTDRIDETGLIPLLTDGPYWNFYEWVEGLDDTKGLDDKRRLKGKIYDSPINAFVSDALYCLSEICKVISPDEADEYLSIRASLNKALHNRFFHEETKLYLTNLADEKPTHNLSNALMLFCGAVPEENKAYVREKIMEEKLTPTTLSMYIYVFDVLLEDMNNLKWVLEKIDDVWGNMVTKGVDTFLEVETGAEAFSNAGSLCHGWSAVPVYIYGKYLDK